MIKWSELLRGAFVGRLCVAGAVAAAAAAMAPSLPPRSTQRHAFGGKHLQTANNPTFVLHLLSSWNNISVMLAMAN